MLFTVVILAVFLWVIPFIGFTPPDYGTWTGPWYREILKEGRIGVFAQPFANYTPPYLYLLSASTFLDGLLPPLATIKLLSAAGAGWTAYAVFKLLKTAGAPEPAKAGLLTLLLPTTVFNVPILGQADTFWVAPCVLAVAAAVNGNMRWMAIWASVGFAFKAQAVFIAPFVAVCLWKRTPLTWYWAIPILIYAAAMFPAWLAGWPASDLFAKYFQQVDWTQPGEPVFIGNAANWWHLFRILSPDTALASLRLGYALAAGATALYFLFFIRRSLDRNGIVAAAVLSAIMLPFLLPGMHERFLALAEILAFCLAWSARDRRSMAIAVLLQIGAICSIGGWLFGFDILALMAIVPVTAALALLLSQLTVTGRESAFTAVPDLAGRGRERR